MRIDGNLKRNIDIINHKIKKAKIKKKEKVSLKLGFVKKDEVRYLKIEKGKDKVLLQIENGTITDLKILSNEKFDISELKKVIEKLGWKVGKVSLVNDNKGP